MSFFSMQLIQVHVHVFIWIFHLFTLVDIHSHDGVDVSFIHLSGHSQPWWCGCFIYSYLYVNLSVLFLQMVSCIQNKYKLIEVCLWLATGHRQCFSLGILVSSTNKNDHQDAYTCITGIMMKAPIVPISFSSIWIVFFNSPVNDFNCFF